MFDNLKGKTTKLETHSKNRIMTCVSRLCWLIYIDEISPHYYSMLCDWCGVNEMPHMMTGDSQIAKYNQVKSDIFAVYFSVALTFFLMLNSITKSVVCVAFLRFSTLPRSVDSWCDIYNWSLFRAMQNT